MAGAAASTTLAAAPAFVVFRIGGNRSGPGVVGLAVVQCCIERDDGRIVP